jgi:hypothetical protein
LVFVKEALAAAVTRYCKGARQASLLRGGAFEETRITPQ